LQSNKSKFSLPNPTKTGTTIAGIVFKDGVVLGADTRSTNDTTVADKNCEKIHYIAPHIYCCGAGTAADTEFTTRLISSQLELHALRTGKQARVVTALTRLKQMLFRYQGYVSAALVLGGVDFSGPHLHTIHPHGSVDTLPYVTMGSGSLAAMSIFENGWTANLTRDQGIQLVVDAIEAGIQNDLGSGSNVDICVITKDGSELLRNYKKSAQRILKDPASVKFPHGTTPVIKTTIEEIQEKLASVEIAETDEPVESL